MKEELMKKEIQEKRKEIGEQLRQMSSKSNPFDDMIYLATEILRNCLFDCSRFGNKDLPEGFRSNKESTERLFDKIMNIYSDLEDLSPEAVEVCRMTSGPMQNWETFNTINKNLINLEKEYDTVYSQYSPVLNEDFLIFKLGGDSEAYKHLLRLRELSRTKFKNFTSDDFSKMMDVLDNSEDVCKNNFRMPEETFIKYRSSITEENLSDTDIQYMRRWKELGHDKIDVKTFKVRKASGEIFEATVTDAYVKVKNNLTEILMNKGLFLQGALSEEEFLVIYELIIEAARKYTKYTTDVDPELRDWVIELIKSKKEYDPDNAYKVFQINQILSVFCPNYAKAEGKRNNGLERNTSYRFIYYR